MMVIDKIKTKQLVIRYGQYILLLFAFFSMNMVLAQSKSKVFFEQADAFKFDKNIGEDVQRLIGHVIIRQDSTLFYCDSAWLNDKTNSFEAFSKVHIHVNDTVNVFSDRLIYNGNTKIAELFDHVKLLDKNTVLTTEHLIYNRITKTALYDAGGKIVNKENTLTSVIGLYFTPIRTFHFRKDVVLVNPDNETYSDTLIYNTNTEIAYFTGPTVIRSEDNIIYTENGWYDTKNDLSKLNERPRISNMEQIIEADSLYYNNALSSGIAYGRVHITDTVHNMIIEGNYGEFWDKRGKAFITDSVMAITYDETDSLYIHADTFWVYFDKERQAKMMSAYFGVRFFRNNLQGKCDSLVYRMNDSTIHLYREPILWSGKNQLTADSISITIVKNEVDSLVMYNSAFIISRDSTDTFNQIKGKNMVAYFKHNELASIHVDGNAQTVYFVREDDGYLIGINLAEASTMQIRVKDNEVQNISYQSSPTETMYPQDKLSSKQTVLKGFIWQNYLRPKKKEDIFKHPEKLEIEKEKSVKD
jgi:lipopolysaccharide export system protein LptA